MSNDSDQAAPIQIPIGPTIAALPGALLVVSLILAPFSDSIYPRLIFILAVLIGVKRLSHLITTRCEVHDDGVFYKTGFGYRVQSLKAHNINDVIVKKQILSFFLPVGKILIKASDGRSITVSHVLQPGELKGEIMAKLALVERPQPQ